jgi:hypothetical protein
MERIDMAKPKQQQVHDLIILEPIKCTACEKLLGYFPVSAPAIINSAYKAQVIAYCSESCALQELQEEPARLYRLRK